MSATRLFARTKGAVLVIEETPEGVYLYELRPDGFWGDTWHQSVGEAQEQAAFQFDTASLSWTPVPDTVDDLAAFVRQLSN